MWVRYNGCGRAKKNELDLRGRCATKGTMKTRVSLPIYPCVIWMALSIAEGLYVNAKLDVLESVAMLLVAGLKFCCFCMIIMQLQIKSILEENEEN